MTATSSSISKKQSLSSSDSSEMPFFKTLSIISLSRLLLYNLNEDNSSSVVSISSLCVNDIINEGAKNKGKILWSMYPLHRIRATEAH